MLMDFLAMIAAGAGVAGLVLIVGRLTGWISGQRLPRWVLPATIGLAMLSFSLWNEYSWYGRVQAALPAGLTVVTPLAETSPMRPWTYAWPLVTRFVALDQAGISHSAERPELVRTQALFVQRWQPSRSLSVAFDCGAGRRAELGPGASLAADGQLSGTRWQELDRADPMLVLACAGRG